MENAFLIFLGILIVIVGLIWYYLFELPKERKVAEKWQNENQTILDSEKNLYDSLQQIGESMPICRKCNGTKMQLWQVDETIVTVRCVSCKTKCQHTQSEDSNWIEIINIYLKGIYYLIDKYGKVQNRKIQEIILNHLRSDYFGLRKGSLYCRAIVFEAIAEEKKTSTKQVNNRKISQKTKDLVWNRDGGKCVECGSQEKLEFDHIIPFSKGGSNTYRNVQLLCENCNRLKSDKIG